MLNPEIHQLLLLLEAASVSGSEWIGLTAIQHISGEQRDIAIRAGWVKVRGEGLTREFKILPSGYTALGDNAEYAVKVMRGEIQPVPVIEPEISVSVYGEQMGADVEDEQGEPVVKTCVEPGCNQPRHGTRNRCKPHAQAADRIRNAKHNAAKKGSSTQSVGKGKRTAAKTIAASFVAIAAEEPPITEEDTERDLLPVVDTPPRFALSSNPGACCRQGHRPAAPYEREHLT